VLSGEHNGSLWPYYRISRPEQILFLPSSSSIVLTRLSGPVISLKKVKVKLSQCLTKHYATKACEGMDV
jgi:hypothetical protein